MPPRTLSTYALASLDQTKRACGIDTALAMGADELDNVMDVIEQATDEVERFLDRQIVTRTNPITEYHTASDQASSVLYLSQFPIILITSVAEGSWVNGLWTASEMLTANVSYVADAAAGTLTRTAGGARSSWMQGFERIKVVYTAGYANTAAVPDAIRRVALSLVSRRWAEHRRGQSGVQSVSDAMGSITRFLPGELLRMEQQALQQFRRFLTTGRAA